MDFVSLDYVTEDWRPKASKNYSVLLGPACSIAGGIPLSPGLLSYINKTYPQQVELAKDRLYHSVMRALSGEQRLAVMQHFVSQAKLSWGYLALAQLIKQGLVSRVYSLNFDPLLEQACALLGVKPACYDCYLNPDLQADELADQAIIYLHGQHTTEVCPDTEEKLSQYKQMLHGLFKRDTEERTWLVLGCSGLYDPVYEVLFEIDEYPNSLYWVGRESYSGHIRAGYYSRRVGEKNYFNFINNSANVEHDLVSLSQSLNCFSPEILLFAEQANSELKRINPLRLPGQSQYLEKGLLEYGLKLNKALESHLSLVTTQLILEQELYLELLHGKYQELIDRYQATASPQNLSAKHRELLALAKFTIAMEWFLEYRLDVYIDDFERCRTILDQALALDENCYEARLKLAQLYLIKAQENKVDDERETEFETAIQHLRRIQKNIPDFWPALLCLAQLYFSRAKLAQGEQQTEDMQLSVETYRELIAMKADCAQAHAELADVFGFLAQSVSTTLQTSYFQHSARHYAQALELKDDDYEIWLKSGNLLQTWAKLKQGAIQLDLLKQSADKYGRAVAIKWDFSEAWHQWGNLLQYWAKLLADDREALIRASHEKYQRAWRPYSTNSTMYFNWACLLETWAELKTGREKIDLLEQSCKKIAIASQNCQASVWNKWAELLKTRASLEQGFERENLEREAAEKLVSFRSAIASQAWQRGAEFSRLYNLTHKDNYWRDSLKEFELAISYSPKSSSAWWHCGKLLKNVAMYACAKDKIEFYILAESRLLQAHKLDPSNGGILENWAELLWSRAGFEQGKVRHRLLQRCAVKIFRRVALQRPDRYCCKFIFYKWKCELDDVTQGLLFAQLVRIFKRAKQYIEGQEKNATSSWQVLSALHKSWAERQTGDCRIELYRDAEQYMLKAIELDPQTGGLWRQLGDHLCEWAELPQASDKAALFARGSASYAQAVKHAPEIAETWLNWANALRNWSNITEHSEKLDLIQQSREKYQRALALNARLSTAWFGLAWLDHAQSQMLPVEARLAHILATLEHISRAVSLQADRAHYWYVWGYFLSCKVTLVSEPERDQVFQLATEKFAKACELEPDSYYAWRDWGFLLLAWARGKSVSSRLSLLAEAKCKFIEAELYCQNILSYGLYNQACAAALGENFQEARSLLESAEASGKLPTLAHVQADHDLDGLRQLPWFIELCQRLDS